MSDQEKDGFQSSNLSSTKLIATYNKIELSLDHINYWAKE